MQQLWDFYLYFLRGGGGGKHFLYLSIYVNIVADVFYLLQAF